MTVAFLGGLTTSDTAEYGFKIKGMKRAITTSRSTEIHGGKLNHDEKES